MFLAPPPPLQILDLHAMAFKSKDDKYTFFFSKTSTTGVHCGHKWCGTTMYSTQPMSPCVTTPCMLQLHWVFSTRFSCASSLLSNLYR